MPWNWTRNKIMRVIWYLLPLAEGTDLNVWKLIAFLRSVVHSPSVPARFCKILMILHEMVDWFEWNTFMIRKKNSKTVAWNSIWMWRPAKLNPVKQHHRKMHWGERWNELRNTTIKHPWPPPNNLVRISGASGSRQRCVRVQLCRSYNSCEPQTGKYLMNDPWIAST